MEGGWEPVHLNDSEPESSEAWDQTSAESLPLLTPCLSECLSVSVDLMVE